MTSQQNSLWKRPGNCNTEYVMMMIIIIIIIMMARLVYLVNPKIIHIIVSEGLRF